jgi:hypothetical protein
MLSGGYYSGEAEVEDGPVVLLLSLALHGGCSLCPHSHLITPHQIKYQYRCQQMCSLTDQTGRAVDSFKRPSKHTTHNWQYGTKTASGRRTLTTPSQAPPTSVFSTGLQANAWIVSSCAPATSRSAGCIIFEVFPNSVHQQNKDHGHSINIVIRSETKRIP